MLRKETREHYARPEVKNTIMRVSQFGKLTRAGNGDGVGWYRMRNGRQVKYNLSISGDYDLVASKYRTMYWTLNLFDEKIYNVNYKDVEKGEGASISREHTRSYTFGVDIDKEHGTDIHDPVVKKAVEDMGQYYADILRKYAPNSVYVAYSGGGIYVYVHHEVFAPYFLRDWEKEGEDPEKMLSVILRAFDYAIGDIKDKFFHEHPEHIGKVKPDELNNSQRIFKTLFSIHKKLDYAVIPLDPVNVEIDFNRATPPLCDDVLKAGEEWYTKYDDGRKFLNEFLKPFLLKAHEEKKHSFTAGNAPDIPVSDVPLRDVEKWPPCMRNLMKLEKGSTRALSALLCFWGQIGIPEDEAYHWFTELVNRWDGRASNMFESNFRVMKTPICAKLNSTDNRGYGSGVSIRDLGVCKPDDRCLRVPSPRYYADREANVKRLMAPKNQTSDSKNNKVRNTLHVEEVENKSSNEQCFTVEKSDVVSIVTEDEAFEILKCEGY